MTDTTTLDAAIVAAQELVYNNHERVVDPLDRTYARALIAKLIEGMERPDWFTTEEDIGWDAAISELSLMTGLEYEV